MPDQTQQVDHLAFARKNLSSAHNQADVHLCEDLRAALDDREPEGLTQIELEALLRVKMGGTADELAALREAEKTGREKLSSALRTARAS